MGRPPSYVYKKPKVALQSILRTAAEKEEFQPLPTNLSIIRDDASGRLITDLKEVITQVQKPETKALSPDPTLPPGAPFPWLCDITLNQQHIIPILSGFSPRAYCRKLSAAHQTTK